MNLCQFIVIGAIIIGSIRILKARLKSMMELLRTEEDSINPADPGTVVCIRACV